MKLFEKKKKEKEFGLKLIIEVSEHSSSSKYFNPNDKKLKFYRTEDEVYKENTTHFKKCKNCFKNM